MEIYNPLTDAILRTTSNKFLVQISLILTSLLGISLFWGLRTRKRLTKNLHDLEDGHESIRVQRGIEFRRSKRTGDEWAAFCPLCHSPVYAPSGGPITCSDGRCHWATDVKADDLPRIIATFE